MGYPRSSRTCHAAQAHGFELIGEIRDHASRALVLEVKLVVLVGRADGLVLLAGDRLETLGHFPDGIEIDCHIVAAPAQVGGDPLCRRMRDAVGQRRSRGVDDVDAVRDGLQNDVGCKPRVAMRMELQRPIAEHILDGRHERRNALGRQQAARILQEDRVDVERNELAPLADVVRVRVDGAVREDQATGDVEAMALCRADRDLQVADVVERIVGRMVAHPVCGEALSGELDDVVGEELEGEQALPARVDDERRFRDPGRQQPHPLPRVLAQIANANIEHRAAHEVDGLEARPVEARGDVAHHRRRHARGPQALVGVAQGDVDELDRAGRGHDWGCLRPMTSGVRA
jgi:hypothetical protein